MRVGVVRERVDRERRVSLTPREASRLVESGVAVIVESEAGRHAGLPDGDYRSAGCSLVDDVAGEADIIASVQGPQPAQIAAMRPGTLVLGLLAPHDNDEVISAMIDRELESYAFELIPRTTRAQGMDVLSSQATAAGYAATLVAAGASMRMLPMLTTAAGTVPPASVLVLGAGVAGLQAIATARRLGAVVSAYDIRPEVAEQIQSLGAKVVAAPYEQTSSESGYAVEVTAQTANAQLEALAPHVARADVVITTAQVPGRRAPMLVSNEMVSSMRAGAVVVDVAAASGGNCEASRPDETVEHEGVIVLGPTDLASRVAYDASRMLGRNVEAFLELLIDGDRLRDDRRDEILVSSRVTPAADRAEAS